MQTPTLYFSWLRFFRAAFPPTWQRNFPFRQLTLLKWDTPSWSSTNGADEENWRLSIEITKRVPEKHLDRTATWQLNSTRKLFSHQILNLGTLSLEYCFFSSVCVLVCVFILTQLLSCVASNRTWGKENHVAELDCQFAVVYNQQMRKRK